MTHLPGISQLQIKECRGGVTPPLQECVVAIIGAGGPIGLMHLQLAVKRGASQIIAVDLVEKRLTFAERLGATSMISSRLKQPVEVIHELTGGRGVDVAIESAGAKSAWITALQSVRKGGQVLWFGGLKAGM